jgi:predicted nucleic acid-binding protein
VGALRALFDTNVLIDYLNGIDAAKAELARASACSRMVSSRVHPEERS